MNDLGLEQIKSVYEDKEAEINGRKYVFSSFTHRERVKVFSFQTRIASQIESGDFSFMDTPEYEKIEKLIFDKVLFEAMQLSKLHDHFSPEKYSEDYIIFISIAMAVISYPFMRGVNGG